jgi:hypothetical protein
MKDHDSLEIVGYSDLDFAGYLNTDRLFRLCIQTHRWGYIVE